MTHTILNLSGPLGLELALGGLLVFVLLLGLVRPAAPDRRCGWVSLAGLIGLSVWAFLLQPGATLFDGAYVLDPLALFTQRLFLVSAAVSVACRATGSRGAAANITSRCSRHCWGCSCSPRRAI